MTRIREPFRLALLCALLAAATFALYRPALGLGFVDYDDPDFVTANPHVLAGLSWSNVSWAFGSGGSAANWQPLAWLSLMLDARLWGESAAGFHLTNVLWHALNAALVLLVFRELTGAAGLSFWAAAVFAFHPLRVESVAWIAERKDVMSVAFGLLTFWAYARDMKRAAGAGRRWYGVALGAYQLGLLCKPMLVTVPAILLLVVVAGRKANAGVAGAAPATTLRRAMLELSPFALAAAACAGMTYFVQRHAGAVNDGFTLAHRAANALLAARAYLADFVWPMRLAVGYPQATVVSAATALGAFAVLAGVSLIAIRLWPSRPWIAAGWIWFLVMLGPVLGLVQVGAQARADRYTYLPSVGLELAAIGLLSGVRSSRVIRLIGGGAGTVALALFGVATRNQLPVWANSTALFEQSLRVTTDNYIALSCRAATLLNEGDLAAAAPLDERALRLERDYVPALLIAGLLDESSGQSDRAETRYRAAIERAPRYAPIHERLGALLLRETRYADALAQFEAVRRGRSEAPTAELGCALALAHLNRFAEADAAFQRAVALRPDYVEAQAGYAKFLDDRGEAARAWPHYAAALSRRPRYGSAQFNYANSLLNHGQPERAIDHFRAAATLEPDDADARLGLATALRQLGHPDKTKAQSGHRSQG